MRKESKKKSSRRKKEEAKRESEMESESGSENASEKSSVKGDEMEETLESKTKPEEVCIKLICICFEQKIQHAIFCLHLLSFSRTTWKTLKRWIRICCLYQNLS